MKKLNEREAALQILTRIREEEIFSHIAVREMLDRLEREGMDRRQRAFVKRLTEGVIERRIELSDIIRRHVKKGTRIRPVIRDILQMGIFQILYMDAVPDSAACNEAVKLTKEYGKKELSGFVNGVLRTVVREKEKGEYGAGSAAAEGPDPEDRAGADSAPVRAGGTHGQESISALSRKYSMPEWIVRMWTEQMGGEETRKLLAALLEIRPVSIRFDDRVSEAAVTETIEQMKARGVRVTRGQYLPRCFYLTGTDSLTTLPGYREGLWTVQDESSMMAAEAAGLSGGETVYDVCAAPGGKSMHCASKLMKLGGGTVHSFDLSRNKVAQIVKNANRMHLDNITIIQRDALAPVPEEEKGTADVLLCDLPCSGLGVIGRKRDIKYHITKAQLEELAALQKKILKNAVSYLKEGGTLIYSTCTINRGENEEVADFIGKETELRPDPLPPHLPEGIAGISGPDGSRLQLLPHVHGTDGFFVARFKKIKEA